MACLICGASEESDLHILFQCSFAERMWEASGVDTFFWACPFQSIRDYLELVVTNMAHSDAAFFVTLAAECWHARNKFVFQSKETNPTTLCKRARDVVHSFQETRDCLSSPTSPHPSIWTPPPSGFLKLNFDGGKIGISGSG